MQNQLSRKSRDIVIIKANTADYPESTSQMFYDLDAKTVPALLSDAYIKNKDALHIINIELRAGNLFLIYHEILQTRCNIKTKELEVELKWVQDYLHDIGFNLDFMISDEALCSVFIEANQESHEDVDFFCTVNVKLLCEKEANLLASHLTDFFITRREEHKRKYENVGK